ncbi:hypothetical protein L1049_012382 [Liquidambar formosana]|uniref:AAA+ ATPase domain-containing protein n=1 Tax=Liquidambar formosana TaxID=63359 RepID=A0AAP0R2B5_LIQFO
MALSFVFFSIAVFCIYINAEQIRDQLAEKIREYVVEKIQEYVALPIGDYLDTPIGLLLGFLLSLAVLYIAGKIRETLEEKIGEYVAAPIRRQIGYVFFYNSNIGNFRTRRENLRETRDAVQRLVDARKGEVILQNVQEWLTNVDKIIEESGKLFDDELQSNLKLLYSRSRYAKEKTVDVDKLIKEGNNFVKVSTSAVGFGSRDGIFKDIMEALKDDKINVIGIYGMPGVGKTTLAKQVLQQAKDDKLFDEVLMSVVSQTPDWKTIQREIAEKLDPKVENKGESQRGQGSTQDKKRILIVLDDIWENVELDEAVGISFGMKQEGWKVVLTSRKKDVYDRMGIAKNFSVEVINEDEAWNLFRKTAGDSIESSDLHPLAVEIAKECGGLPIAIVTIASTIRGKSYSFLRDVLKKLQNSTQGQKVNSAIELSYNHVDDDEAKKIFLLCCLFPEDYDIPIQVLMMYGMGLRWFEDVFTVEEASYRMEEIVGNDKEAASAAAVDDIRFPKLRSLNLSWLPKLNNFCYYKMEGDLDTSTEEALFGKKVRRLRSLDNLDPAHL